MKIRKELIIGLVVLVGIAMVWFGTNYLKGINVFNKNRYFYSIYADVAGLVSSNPIIINGFKVGQVIEIKILPDNRLIVEFSIDEDSFKFSKDSHARIFSSDLFGSKAISIVPGESAVIAVNGDTLMSDIETDMKTSINQQLKPIQDKANSLFGKLDSLVETVDAVFSNEIEGNVSQSFESVKRAIATLENTAIKLDTLVASEKNRISAIFTNVESITSNLKNSNEKISNILTNLSAVSDSLAEANILQILDNANDAIYSFSVVAKKIENGEGTLGMLVKDDKLYNRLAGAADELENLIDNLESHPERYLHFSIFGKKNKGLRLSNSDKKWVEKQVDQKVKDNLNITPKDTSNHQ